MALFCLLFSIQQTIGQSQIILVDDNSQPVKEDKRWLTEYDRNALNSHKLAYFKRSGFKEVYGGECFENNKRLFNMLTCQSNELYSRDKHFMTFLVIYRVLSLQEITFWKKVFPKFKSNINESHIDQIKGYIRPTYGQKADTNWKQYVHYYTQKKAKQMFNADSVISLIIPLKPGEYYKGKYKYLEAIFIQKNGCGYATLNCFYDETGKKKRSKYLKKLQGVLRFVEKPQYTSSQLDHKWLLLGGSR